MKYRLGFVTNSSSSSFIISKYYLTPQQIDQIKDYINVAESVVGGTEDSLGYTEFGWLDEDFGIEENEKFIGGSTWMDNFDMYAFLDYIKVPQEKVKWFSFSYDLETMIRKQEEE